MGEENRYLYVVIREHDAVFKSVHLTRRAALDACRRDMPGHHVLIVDTEHACKYMRMLTNAKREVSDAKSD